MMWKPILVFVFQIIFEFLRTLNVRYTSRDMVFATVLTGFFVKITWLVTTYLGVSSLIEGDYFTASMYVIGGVIGNYASFKVKIR